MIQNVFFPDRIGTYSLFRKKIVGIHITPQAIYATVLIAQGRTLALTKTYLQEIIQEKGNQQEKTSEALIEIMKKVGSYDSLISTLTSSYIMFKELRFPFITKEKIALALPYEIEPFLPFPLSDAFFDFSLVKINTEKNYSEVIVAAVQKKHLYDHLQLFSKAGVHHETVTVDMLDIYGLYTKINHLYPMEENGVIAVWDDAMIHVSYLHEGTIKTVRSLIKDKDERKTWQSLFFTLQSFSQEYGVIQKILFMQTDMATVSQAQEQLGIPCELFTLRKNLPALGIIQKDSSDITTEEPNLFSLAAAYPSSFTTDFTLATEQQQNKQDSLFKQQVIACAGLTTILLCAMSIHTFLQVHKLSTAVSSTRESIVKELKKNFPSIKSGNLTQAMKTAKQAVSKEEEIWFSFSNQTRHSFLKYLYTLSTKIEPEILGLQLKKMVINKDTLLIEGSVRNFPAVEQLEKDLKDSHLFMHVPDLQKTEFSVPLTLSKKGDVA
jgi:hypothetical protein